MRIEMAGIHKAFGKNAVLKGVDFDVQAGEIHALMGENGAGKSTLMNILTGLYEADAGEIRLSGETVHFANPKEAENHGLAFIHQELNMWPDLSVLDNLFMGKEKSKKWGRLDRAGMKEIAETVFNRLGIRVDLNQRVRDVAIGTQQLIEIARALLADVKILIMDEPTTSLTDRETQTIFKVIRELADQGVGIIYISHRMEEVFMLTERITVMRDGVSVGTKATASTNQNEIVKMMVGRELADYYPDIPQTIIRQTPLMEVENFTKAGQFEGIHFKLYPGEVLGISGLMGSGRTEVMRALFAATTVDSGSIRLDGKLIDNKNPRGAIKNGFGFVTENRKDEGLILDFSIRDNLALASLNTFKQAFGKVNRGKLDQFVEQLLAQLRVKTSGSDERVRDLSGGNQQKIVLAKWIGSGCRVLILDEPTKGVDVGAKREIYELIRQLANKGVGIIMVSSDLPEILGMSDRIMVMHEGRIAGFIDHDHADEEAVMTLATGGKL